MQQNAVHDRHAKQRDEADGGGDAEIQTGDVKRQHAAGDGEGNPRKRQQALQQRIEQAIEQAEDQQPG